VGSKASVEASTVAGGAPLVNTTNSSLGGLVQADEVASLPLNGRNYELVITRYSWMPSSPSVLPEKLAVEPPFASPGSVVGSALRYIRARCNPRLQ